jgi:hypothetical protein
MRRAIYEIDSDIHRILAESGEEGELTPEAAEQLKKLEMEIIDKITSIVGFVRFTEGWAEMAAAEAKRIGALKKQYERKVDQVYDFLKLLMEAHQMERIDLPTGGKLWIQDSPPKAELDGNNSFIDPTMLPFAMEPPDGVTTTEEERQRVIKHYCETGEDLGWTVWYFSREKTIVEPDKTKAIEFFKRYGKAPPGWKIVADQRHLVIR